MGTAGAGQQTGANPCRAMPKPAIPPEPRALKTPTAVGSLTRTGVGVALVGALLLGIWVNNTAWRHRRLIWQLQAALGAGSVGFVAGRLSR